MNLHYQDFTGTCKTTKVLLFQHLEMNLQKKKILERNRKLKAELLGRGYGVTRILGSYIENFETPKAVEVAEESFFVSNRKRRPRLCA